MARDTGNALEYEINTEDSTEKRKSYQCGVGDHLRLAKKCGLLIHRLHVMKSSQAATMSCAYKTGCDLEIT